MKNRVILEISQVFLILFLDLMHKKVSNSLFSVQFEKFKYAEASLHCKNIYTHSIFILFP